MEESKKQLHYLKAKILQEKEIPENIRLELTNDVYKIESALNIGSVSGSFLLRLLLSPLLFLWGCILLAAGTLFPLPLLVMISVVGMISVPFVWLLRKSGSEINYIEPLICDYNDFEKEKNIFRGHFFGATIYLWGAFAVAYHYVKTGEIFTGD